MPSLIGNGPVALENKILKILNVLLLFHYFLLLEKGVDLHLNQLRFPSSRDAFVQSLLEIVSVVLERMRCKDRWMDNGQAHLSFQLR